MLAARSGDLRGILNGIDVDEWNPSTDPHLPARFDARHMAGKAKCKAALQKEAGFPVRPDVPLFGLVGRLTTQKGVDVLAHALDQMLAGTCSWSCSAPAIPTPRASSRAPTPTAATAFGPG